MKVRKFYNDVQFFFDLRQMNFNFYFDENFQISNIGFFGVDEEGDR